MQDLFARNRLPLPVAGVVAHPGPRTLVNLSTRLEAGSAVAAELTTTVLGVTVHVTATPSTWHWSLDGDHESTRAPGLRHTFLEPGSRTAQVTVTWTGTFRLGDDPRERRLTRPAVVPGKALDLQVLEAHAERVSR